MDVSPPTSMDGMPVTVRGTTGLKLRQNLEKVLMCVQAAADLFGLDIILEPGKAEAVVTIAGAKAREAREQLELSPPLSGPLMPSRRARLSCRAGCAS